MWLPLDGLLCFIKIDNEDNSLAKWKMFILLSRVTYTYDYKICKQIIDLFFVANS